MFPYGGKGGCGDGCVEDGGKLAVDILASKMKRWWGQGSVGAPEWTEYMRAMVFCSVLM